MCCYRMCTVAIPTQMTLNWKPRLRSLRSIWVVMLSKPTWLLGITGPCWVDIVVAVMGWARWTSWVCLERARTQVCVSGVSGVSVYWYWARCSSMVQRAAGKELQQTFVERGLTLARLQPFWSPLPKSKSALHLTIYHPQLNHQKSTLAIVHHGPTPAVPPHALAICKRLFSYHIPVTYKDRSPAWTSPTTHPTAISHHTHSHTIRRSIDIRWALGVNLASGSKKKDIT